MIFCLINFLIKTSDSNLACSCLVLPNIKRRVNLSIYSLHCDRVPLSCAMDVAFLCSLSLFRWHVSSQSSQLEVLGDEQKRFILLPIPGMVRVQNRQSCLNLLVEKNPHFIKKIKGQSRTKAEDLASSSISFSSLSPWVPINISNCYWEEIRALKLVMCSEHFSSWVPAQMGSYQELYKFTSWTKMSCWYQLIFK